MIHGPNAREHADGRAERAEVQRAVDRGHRAVWQRMRRRQFDRAGADGGGSAVAVAARQQQQAGTGLRQGAAAADVAADGQAVCRVGHVHEVSRRGQGQRQRKSCGCRRGR